MPRTQGNAFIFGHGNWKIDFKITTWNLLSFYRSGACQNVVKISKTYGVKVAALKEIRLKGTGKIRLSEHEIYFLGIVERHIYGSGFVVNKLLAPHIKKCRPVSEKISVLSTAVLNNRPIDIILVSVHASMDTNGDNMKNRFFNEDLDRIYNRLPKKTIKLS